MSILKKFRLEKEWSQQKMAEKLNITLRSYQNYERGKRTMPPKVLISFLALRAYDDDIKLLKILTEIYK